MDLRNFLGCCKPRSLRFSEFMREFVSDPLGSLRTSAGLISDAIHDFGFEIVVRSGEPAISYKLFKDPFSGGTNAVFGQEDSIRRIVEVIESMGRESGPQRGIVLVGPPASGKTNVVDLVTLALESYSKRHEVKLYSFYFRFENGEGKAVELRPKFRHNPILLFPTSLQLDGKTTHPRQALFEHVNRQRGQRGKNEKIAFPTYYQSASVDKRSLDIIERLEQNPRNSGKTLFELLETYVRVEEVDFSSAQAKGIANVDDMRHLAVGVQPVDLGEEDRAIVNEHLPASYLYDYEGALVFANRGLLHVHDAFGGEGREDPGKGDYKPLLMLLGSGKTSVESTQVPIDTTVIATTNLEEMARLGRRLTSSKLIDRIDEIPVNYLLDAYAEMDILKRDLANVPDRYDVDPNLLRIAAYFSVLTRLLPPMKAPSRAGWSEEKKKLYLSITPEQKLFIYAAEPSDPLATIAGLPEWHPFRNELVRRHIDVRDPASYEHLVAKHPDRVTLARSGVFTVEQLEMIDDEFMRALRREHYPHEGKGGMSVRQLQNLMRGTFADSNGFRVHVGAFLSRLRNTIAEGPPFLRSLGVDEKLAKDSRPVSRRVLGGMRLEQGEGGYGDVRGLAKVTQAIYADLVRREISEAAVNRDPQDIGLDLRKYVQHALLAAARGNRTFSRAMVPRFTYFDPHTGETVDRPDANFMKSIEKILAPESGEEFRRKTAERFFELSGSGKLVLEEGKTALASRNDNFLSCFGQEYSRLLSHPKAAGEVDPEQLRDALFEKRMAPEFYEARDRKTRDYAEEIVRNMEQRFRYSPESALDTILFALRKGLVDFSAILG